MTVLAFELKSGLSAYIYTTIQNEKKVNVVGFEKLSINPYLTDIYGIYDGPGFLYLTIETNNQTNLGQF